MTTDNDLDDTDDSEEKSSSGSGGVAARIASSAAQRMGYADMARLIKRWPEVLGDKIGEVGNAFGAGKMSAEEAERELNIVKEQIDESVKKDPVAMLGFILANELGELQSAEDERRSVLEAYRQQIEFISGIAKELGTSFALRGFIDREDCVSYWRNISFSDDKPFDLRKDILRRNILAGVEIYILEETPDQEVLDALNTEIRKKENRDIYDVTADAWAKVPRVDEIHELKIVSRLNDEGFSLEAMAHKTVVDIPFGAPALRGLVASLVPAIQAQRMHSRLLSDTLDQSSGAEVD